MLHPQAQPGLTVEFHHRDIEDKIIVDLNTVDGLELNIGAGKAGSHAYRYENYGR